MDEQNGKNCQECLGSGACDPCDGYGFYPDSQPGAGDGPECEFCAGSGECPTCRPTAPQALPQALPAITTTRPEDVIPR